MKLLSRLVLGCLLGGCVPHVQVQDAPLPITDKDAAFDRALTAVVGQNLSVTMNNRDSGVIQTEWEPRNAGELTSSYRINVVVTPSTVQVSIGCRFLGAATPFSRGQEYLDCNGSAVPQQWADRRARIVELTTRP